MAKRCPSCQAKVPDDARDCPYCPMSFRQEDEEGHSKHRRHHVSAPMKGVVIAALIGGLGFLAWSSLTFFMEHADSPESGFSMKNLSEGPRAASPAQPAPGQTQSYHIQRDGDRAPEPESEGPSDSASGLGLERKEEPWRLRGTVYDLVTLEPLRGVSMTFLDSQSDTRLKTVTDRQGRYRVTLPPLHMRGYSVKISRDGYASDYLNPGAQNVRGLPHEDRTRLSRELAQSVNGPYDVEAVGGEPLTTDFYLAPLANY